MGDAFYWSVPILSKAMMDLLIGFLAFTSEAVQPEFHNSSKLDLTVLEALDCQSPSEQEFGNELQMNFLEAMVLKQRSGDKHQRVFLKGESIGQLEVVESAVNDDLDESIINIPVSDHFEFRKYEDHNNEKRPTHKE